MGSRKIVEKALKVDAVEVNKKEYHDSKQAFVVKLVDIDKMLISDNFQHSDRDSKYFIGYKKNDIIRLYVLFIDIIRPLYNLAFI